MRMVGNRIRVLVTMAFGALATAGTCGGSDGDGSAGSSGSAVDYNAACDKAFSSPDCKRTAQDCKNFLNSEWTAFTRAGCWDDMTPWIQCVIENETMDCNANPMEVSWIDPTGTCNSLAASGSTQCCKADPESFLCGELGCVNCGSEDSCYCCVLNDNANVCYADYEEAEKFCAGDYDFCSKD